MNIRLLIEEKGNSATSNKAHSYEYDLMTIVSSKALLGYMLDGTEESRRVAVRAAMNRARKK